MNHCPHCGQITGLTQGGLTKRQRDLMLVIQKAVETTGIAPSFEQMAEEIGLKSTGNIHRLVVGLEERGFITRIKHRARGIYVRRWVEERTETQGVN